MVFFGHIYFVRRREIIGILSWQHLYAVLCFIAEAFVSMQRLISLQEAKHRRCKEPVLCRVVSPPDFLGILWTRFDSLSHSFNGWLAPYSFFFKKKLSRFSLLPFILLLNNLSFLCSRLTFLWLESFHVFFLSLSLLFFFCHFGYRLTPNCVSLIYAIITHIFQI